MTNLTRAAVAALAAALLFPFPSGARAQPASAQPAPQLGHTGSGIPPMTRKTPGLAHKPLRVDKGVEGKLDRLSPDQKLQVNGREMTVGEFRKRMATDARRAEAAFRRPGPGNASALSRVATKFDQAQAAKLAASNAKVRAEVARLTRAQAGQTKPSARLQEIREEARALESKRKGGGLTPAETQRVRELYGEYQQLR